MLWSPCGAGVRVNPRTVLPLCHQALGMKGVGEFPLLPPYPELCIELFFSPNAKKEMLLI